MGKRLRATLKNPLVIVLPIVAISWFGWSAYMRTINRPDHAEHNLLQNGEFESLGKAGLPAGWTVDSTGGVNYLPLKVPGFGGGSAFETVIDTYTSGNLDLKSPATPVKAGVSYYYKSYHKATKPFWVLMRDYHKDGSSTLRVIQEYGTTDEWAANSIAFRPDGQTVRVQIVYRMAAKGSLTIDRAFMDRRNGVYVPEDPQASRKDMLVNGAVSETDEDGGPVAWTPYHKGDNDAELLRISKDGEAYLHASAVAYKDGEIKWEHEPLATSGGQYVAFSVDYKSTVPAKVVAEFSLKDGSRTFMTLDTVPLANEWTHFKTYSESPENAEQMTITLVLTSSGTVETDNYQISDITKPGNRHFEKPLLSLAFQDGWESGYTTAARIMGYVNFDATFYVNPAAIDQSGFLSASQIKELLDKGNQLGAGSNEYVDLTTLNSRQLQRQLQLSRDYFSRQYNQGNIDFAPTSGHDDAAIQAFSHSYFRSSLSGYEGVNTKQNFDPYNLKTLYINKDTTLKRIETAINETKQKHGWLILVYHRIQDNTGSPEDVTSKAFTDQIELIHNSKIKVRTVGDALEEVWGQ